MMRKLLSSLRLIDPDPYLTAVPFKEPPQRIYGTLKRDVYQLVMIGVMLLLALSLLLNLNLLLKPTQLPNLPDSFSMSLLNTCNTFNESSMPLSDWNTNADSEQSSNLVDGQSLYLSEKYARVDDSKKKQQSAVASANSTSTIYASSRTVGFRMAIIGSSGYIGSRLLTHLRAAGAHSVIGYDKVHAGRSSSEISDDDLHSYHIVLYLGGITTRKVCAENGEKCKRENVDDIRSLAKRMKDSQTLIFASTLAINDAKPGQQNWNPVPETMPASKAADRLALSMFQREAELRRLSQERHSPKFIGLRLGKVIGLSPNQKTNFVYDSMICSAFTNGRIPLVHDEVVNTVPVLSVLWMDDLARAVQTLVDRVEDVSERFQLFRMESFSMTAVQVANQIAAHTSAIIDGSDADGGMMKHMIVSPEGNFPADLSDFSTRFEFEFQGSSCAVIHQLMKEAPRICMARSAAVRAPAIAASEKESLPCAVCGHRHMSQVLDLDRHPLPNQFRIKSEAEQLETFPLKLMRCTKCHHAQLSSFVEVKSKSASYSTLDGHQSGMNKYLQFATFLCDKVVGEKVSLLRHHGTVIEIGPVDQQLLDHFLQRSWSTHIVTDTPLQGEARHTIHIGNWGVDDFSALPRGDNVDSILVQDVFSHTREPVKFLKTTRAAMGAHTKLYIRLSKCNLFDTAEFDAISHERLSYFTAHSMQRAAQLSGLRIIEFDRLPESLKDTSDSCLVTLQADSTVQHDVALLPAESGEANVHDPIQFALLKEREYGISDPFFYLKFESKIQTTRAWMSQQLADLSASHFTIVGYGADPNAMTLLHSLLPTSKTEGAEWEFAYFVDDAPLRQGAFIPGTSIPIKSTSALSQHDFEKSNLALVVMRWDNTEEIVKGVVEMVRPSRDRVFYAITPFPTQRVLFVDAQAQMHIDAERKASGRDYVPNTNELMDPSTDLNGNAPRALPYPVLRQNIQKAVPWPTVFRPRRKVYILVHMYNEELLLPYFIRHHAPIVDGAILVDYHSNDRSLAIIEQQAPASWKYVTSINKGFDSASCDQEIMAYEREIGDNWKVVLTLTEFLVHANLREWLYTIERTQPHIEAVRFQHFVMAGSDRKPLKYIPSLLTQRSEYALVPASVDSGSSYSRFLHRCTKCSYSIGRHNLFGTEWRWADDGFISKYMWTPWPNILPRKLAVGVQLSPSDIAKGYGVQHSRNERQMIETRLKDLEGGSDTFSNIRPITRKVGSASAHRTWYDYTRGH